METTNEDFRKMNKRLNKRMIILGSGRGVGKSMLAKKVMDYLNKGDVPDDQNVAVAQFLNQDVLPEDQNIHNYSWLVNEWELIEAKVSKLSATRRAEVVKEYERTHDTEYCNE